MRWVIGDVHGMIVPLRALVAAVAARDKQPRLFFVGDYVNRGPDSHGVIELLLSLPDSRFARGNHDDVLDLIVNGKSYVEQNAPTDAVTAFRWFLQFGLDRTLTSYGVELRDIQRVYRKPTLAAVNELLAPVPQTHREFLGRLEPLIEEPDLFIAHASWPTIEPAGPTMSARLAGSADLRHRLIWGRFLMTEILADKPWERPGYFGHTPVANYADLPGARQNQPTTGPGITLLDTAAALGPGGRLTAWCVEQNSFLQADPQGNVLRAGLAK